MKTYIIAEMAWSYTGSFERSIEMLEGAYNASADAMSIHITDMPTYMVEDYKCIVGGTLSDSADQSETIYNYLNKINLSEEDWIKFDSQANELGIDLIVMCNDQHSFEFSKKLNVKRYVLSAASFLEFDFVENIVKYNPNIILRTGGATLKEVDHLVDFILGVDSCAKISLLAGIQLYPTPIDELHLASLRTISDRYNHHEITIGLADHIDGEHPFAIHLPALALAYGAQILEKHITTDREEKLEDYEAALGIEQFVTFVDYVRLAEQAIGDGSIAYMEENDSYIRYRLVGRKKVVAATDLSAGTILTREMLAFKRADYGAQLDELDKLVGSTLLEDKASNEGIDVDNLLTTDELKDD